MWQDVFAWLKARQSYVAIALTALTFGVWAGCTVRGTFDHIVGAPPPAKNAAELFSFGWKDDPVHVAKTLATFPQRFFGDAAKGIIEADVDKDAFLWKIHEKIAGHPWKAHNQNGTGCCVGEGFSAGVEVLTAVGIATDGQPHELVTISASAMYALARESGDYLGSQDGSSGADAAKALMDFGAISSEDAKDDNTSGAAHGAVAKKWGRSGLPSDLKAIAAKHKVKTVTLVRTPEEVRAAVNNGYPCPICSSVGFEGNGGFVRDAEGFCRAGGTWPHCMVIVAYRADKKAFLVLQSWGENQPSGPKTLDQPNCSFWITWQDCQRIVRSGESYALSQFNGYPSQKLDVFVQQDRPSRDQHLARASLAFPLAP